MYNTELLISGLACSTQREQNNTDILGWVIVLRACRSRSKDNVMRGNLKTFELKA